MATKHQDASGGPIVERMGRIALGSGGGGGAAAVAEPMEEAESQGTHFS